MCVCISICVGIVCVMVWIRTGKRFGACVCVCEVYVVYERCVLCYMSVVDTYVVSV